MHHGDVGGPAATVPPGWWQRALASIPDPVAVLGPGWEVLWVSPAAAAASGLDPEAVLGRVLWEAVPGTATSEEPMRRAARTGTTTTWEARIGGPRWYELQAVPLDGLLLVVARSADERRRAAAELAASLERTRLVLEVSTALGAARTLDEVAAAVVAVATEKLGADYGGLSVVDRATRRVRTASRAQIDPEVEEAWADLPLDHPGPAPHVCRTGEELVFERLEDVAARFPDVADRVLRSGLRSGVVVPLVAEDVVVGALTVGWREDGRVGGGVLDVVRASAGATGQAVRRALLLADRASAAEVLQRALLAPLPQGLDVELAARYLPAGRRDHVGGDWHDAVRLDGGRLALVVGDVAGHDVEAAAVMGRASGALRSFLLAVDGLPSRALTAADDAFWRLDVPAPATVVAGVLTPPGRGGARSWRWANAGHPPPLLVPPGGRTRVLARRPELLLGVDPSTHRTDHVVGVPPGSVLLLHSDGLVERRDRDLDQGTADLAALLGPLVAEHADAPLEALLDALLAAALPGRPADDVVVLAVRTPERVRAAISACTMAGHRRVRPDTRRTPTGPGRRAGGRMSLSDDDITTTTGAGGAGGDADSGDSDATQVDPAGSDPAGVDPAGGSGGDADSGDSDSTQVDPAGADPAGVDPAGGSGGDADSGDSDSTQVDPAGSDPAGVDPANS